MIKTYKKRPVEVQAVQWTGENTDEIREFTKGKRQAKTILWPTNQRTELIIPTLEGDHYASVGDYIIRGVKGEFYPCKPDIFEETYEESVMIDPNLFSSENTMTVADLRECILPDEEEIKRLIPR